MEQGALGAAGVRRVWAGAGLQRAAYRGGSILPGFPHSLFNAANCIISTFLMVVFLDFIYYLCDK